MSSPAYPDGIPEWFAGKTLFITGATGFMGKVLLEKLLRCCPDIKRIYILCRPKKGFSPAARIEEIFRLPLFDKLRKENPGIIKKLVALEGNIMEKKLGLVEHDEQVLIEETHIVINGAASLRLEAGLKPAVQHNTIGTQTVLQLASKMKNLLAFVHLSTAFCHCEYEVLDESVYPSPVNPKDIIEAVQWMDETTLDLITPRLLGPHPNCYTFSKRLAESLVNEYSKQIPITIVRPSIVTPAYKEPLPGWVDSLNGPVGVIVAGGKGLIRSMMAAEDFYAEVIPVDIAINTIIAVTWLRGHNKNKDVPVYNITSGDYEERMTWGEVLKKGKKLSYEYPFEAGLWYPGGTLRMNPFTHYLIVLLLQIIPAYFIDLILYAVGQKTFMVRVQKRIFVGMKVLQYFTTRKWAFVTDNAKRLTSQLNEKDQEVFYISNVKPDVDQYLLDIILGARQYCMKEPLSTLPKARFQLKVLYWVNVTAQIFLVLLAVWLLSDVLHLNKLYSLVIKQ